MVEDLRRLRLARLDTATSGTLAGGVWLRFAYSDDAAVFEAGKTVIKDLPRTWRRWDPQEKAWWLSESGLRTLARDVPCVAAPLAHYDERRQTQEREEAARRPAEPPLTIADAFAVLHLRSDAPIELVQGARRVLSRLHHPDLGGDLAAMKRINVAADMCEEWLSWRTQTA